MVLCAKTFRLHSSELKIPDPSIAIATATATQEVCIATEKRKLENKLYFEKDLKD